MKNENMQNLILQSLTHEQCGVKVYETAIDCCVNEDLREEWSKYLEQTKNHVRVLTEVCTQLGLNKQPPPPGCKVIEHMGSSLVQAMQMAKQNDKPEAAELVACECVVIAETKDHLDWELISLCAESATGAEKKILTQAADEVEDEEDEHLYHTKGWCRELWLKSLGMKAVLPPPEEKKHVTTAIGASKAEKESLRAR